MGYEVTRFIHKVDDEFLCAICLDVLRNPVQTECEHAFCRECITESIAINNCCPTDRRPIRSTDLKLLPRILLNLLKKLEMKCDFRSKGCKEIVKLENLQQHLNSCQYDPDNSFIACDKGCKLQISRREYEQNNCMQHALNRVAYLEKQISKLTIDKMKKSSATAPSNEPMWYRNVNMFITMDQSNYILKGHNAIGNSLSSVQANYSLTPANSSFRVQFHSGGFIGLSCKDSLPSQDRGIGKSGMYVYFHTIVENYQFYHNLKFREIRKSNLASNDGFVECSITFPYNFDASRGNYVEVCFSTNNRVFERNIMRMPCDGLLPTILLENGTSCTYFTD